MHPIKYKLYLVHNIFGWESTANIYTIELKTTYSWFFHQIYFLNNLLKHQTYQYLVYHLNNCRGFGFITFGDPSRVDKVLAQGTHELDGKKVWQLINSDLNNTNDIKTDILVSRLIQKWRSPEEHIRR